MNEARFFELLSAYGADISRWPEAERFQAEQLMRTGPHRLRDLWESERAFDRLLAIDAVATPSVGLESRILAAAPSSRPQRVTAAGRGVSLPRWATGGALAASLLLGVLVGYSAEPSANLGPNEMLTIGQSSAGAVFLSALTESDSGHE
jgi:hypothetical protein